VVPDVFEGARTHYDDRAIAAVITSIALINTWNWLTFATRQVAGEWAKSAEAERARSAA
jgi:alkylhydroperoxidase family enzyme